MKFPRNARLLRSPFDVAPFVAVFFLLLIFLMLVWYSLFFLSLCNSLLKATVFT